MSSSKSSSHTDHSSLELKLDEFIENMRQINVMVADMQPQGQTVLNHKIKQIVTDLQDIDKLKNDVMDVKIPMAVFDYIDKGQNPQLYTKDQIQKAAAKNEEAKGKIDSYRRFKAHMLVELNKTFPREINKYRAIRKDRHI